MTDAIQAHRERIWKELRRIGRPDSRFHWDFSSFIADFDDNAGATDRVAELPAWQAADRVFITPDNSTERLRRRALADGKTLLVTTYGIRRGFMELAAGSVPQAEISYASTLDGIDAYGVPRTLEQLEGGNPFGILITGGSAVSSNGIRFGKGHGYFDLEWAILSEIGLTSEQSQVVDIVHDLQVVEDVLEGEPHDVAVDWVVTPTRTIAIENPQRELGHVFWNLIPGSEHETIPPIMELAQRRKSHAN